MGIDRWKQEHRNWRPNGVRLVISDAQVDAPAPAAASPAPGDKTSGAKPRAVKKPTASPSSDTKRSSEKIQAKRGKR